MGFESLLADQRVAILDGGTGTTLERNFGMNISDTPMWFSAFIQNNPDVLVKAHLAFLEAGANIILTPTYQASLETYSEAGIPPELIPSIMRKGVALAVEARSQFLASSKPPPNVKPLIALSLGPFGATLHPGQEYDGFYPPPYGPVGLSDDSSSVTPTTAFRTLNEQELYKLERASEQALKEFHLTRLRIFKDDPTTWNSIDCIAFETIPLAREARAIRAAMAELEKDASSADKRKPYWIVFPFPNGLFPQESALGGTRLSVQDVVDATLGQDKEDSDTASSIPSGIGINCTRPIFLPSLLSEFTHAVQSCLSHSSSKPNNDTNTPAPWFVIYPNGEDSVYNPVLKTWSPAEIDPNLKGTWADRLMELVRPYVSDLGSERNDENVWGGAILGGCCLTGPDDIAQLANQPH